MLKTIKYKKGVGRLKLQIYTDGSCSGNPGPGGWACIINLPEESKVISGGSKETTNNRMELSAIIEALKYIDDISWKERHDLYEIFSDSAYVINAIQKGWICNWKNNGWKTKANEDVKNIDLWKEFDKLYCNIKEEETISFIKVKGHKGDFFNEMADTEARKQTKIFMED